MRVLNGSPHVAFRRLVAGLHDEVVDVACGAHDGTAHVVVTDGDTLTQRILLGVATGTSLYRIRLAIHRGAFDVARVATSL